jgi:hypothetical protein
VTHPYGDISRLGELKAAAEQHLRLAQQYQKTDLALAQFHASIAAANAGLYAGGFAGNLWAQRDRPKQY